MMNANAAPEQVADAKHLWELAVGTLGREKAIEPKLM
jgi:hypothetical protein